MPKGDKTGPVGMGPMTGRAAGYCAGYDMPGYTNAVFGRGISTNFTRTLLSGMGCFGGGGRGRRNMFYATGIPGYLRFGGTSFPVANMPINSETVKKELQNRAEFIQKELEAIKKQIDKIEIENDNK